MEVAHTTSGLAPVSYHMIDQFTPGVASALGHLEEQQLKPVEQSMVGDNVYYAASEPASASYRVVLSAPDAALHL